MGALTLRGLQCRLNAKKLSTTRQFTRSFGMWYMPYVRHKRVLKQTQLIFFSVLF